MDIIFHSTSPAVHYTDPFKYHSDQLPGFPTKTIPSSSSVSAPLSLDLDLCVETEEASEAVDSLIPNTPVDACEVDEGAGDGGTLSGTIGF
jgi:hypothetical protein